MEEFWARVGENLRAGKLRMVFVSDEIPRELRRVVEFLNGQMNPAEVIAIEVKQYLAADGTKTLVPRVIGQTAEVEARKGRRVDQERRVWDETSLFTELQHKRGPEEARIARDLYDWTLARGWTPRFGAGKQDGSWTPVLTANGRQHTPLALYTNGRIELQFKYLKARAPFDNVGIRVELLRRLNEIPGIALGSDAIDKTPSIQLALLAENNASSEQLKRVLDWLEAEAKRPRSGARGERRKSSASRNRPSVILLAL